MRPLIVRLHIKLKMCTDRGQSMGPGLGWERKPGASTGFFLPFNSFGVVLLWVFLDLVFCFISVQLGV